MAAGRCGAMCFRGTVYISNAASLTDEEVDVVSLYFVCPQADSAVEAVLAVTTHGVGANCGTGNALTYSLYF